jgi:hypothetical protein
LTIDPEVDDGGRDFTPTFHERVGDDSAAMISATAAATGRRVSIFRIGRDM